MAKCNLAPELRDKYLRRAEFWAHSGEELEACRQYFDNYLFCDRSENWADPDNDFPGSPPTKGYHCTACGERFSASKDERPEYFRLKHNDTTRCPYCDRSVTVKQMGRIRGGLNLSQSTAVTFINVAGSGAVCLDSCIVFYDYNRERNPGDADMDVSHISKRRYYMEQGAVMEWRGSMEPMYYPTDRGGWTEATNVQEPFQANVMYGYDGFGYLVGLDKLEKSQLRYSAVVKYFAEYHNLDITEPETPVRLFVKYLAEYALNNRIEMALKIMDDSKKTEAYQKRRKTLEKKYGYTCDGMSIVVPRGIEDIVREGKTLEICVGGYAHRHVEGKTTILFLRHERRPERSWLCIELDTRGNIVQIHGYKNEGYPHAIAPRERYREWLEQWQNWYRSGSLRDSKGKPIKKERRKSA